MTGLEIDLVDDSLGYRTASRRLRSRARRATSIAQVRAGATSGGAGGGAGAGAAAFGYDLDFIGDGVLSAQAVGGGAGDFAVQGFVVDPFDAGDGNRGAVAFACRGEVVV